MSRRTNSLAAQLRAADRRKKSELTRVEVIASHYTQGRHLTDAEEQYRLQLEHANQLALEGYPRRQVAEMLQEHFGIMRTAAYRAIGEAEELFGSVNKASKEGLRYLLTEQLKEIAQAAKEKGDLEMRMLALGQIAKINKLDVEDKPAPKILMPKAIIFSSDPKTLEIQHQQEEAEDVEYEDVP